MTQLMPFPFALRHTGDHSGGGSKFTTGPLDKTEGWAQINGIRNEERELIAAQVQVLEHSRSMEKLLRGKTPREALLIMQRVCGVCPVVHGIAAVEAARKALLAALTALTASCEGFKISRRTQLLELIAMLGGTLKSHLEHIYGFVAPEMIRVDSILAPDAMKLKVVRMAMDLIKVATKVTDYVTGRSVHPVTFHLTGSTAEVDAKGLLGHAACIERAKNEYFERMVEFIATMRSAIPDFEVPRRFVALDGDEYPLHSGDHVLVGDLGRLQVRDFFSLIREDTPPHSKTYFVTIHDEPYVVGAAARWFYHEPKLSPYARSVAAEVGLPSASMNPFHNTLAQLVECAHILSILPRLLTELAELPDEELPMVAHTKDGVGIGACEAPRGTLFHWALYRDGKVASARALIPTSQNLAAMERDLFEYARPLAQAGATDGELSRAMIALAHSYDLCMSCAVRMLKKEDLVHSHVH